MQGRAELGPVEQLSTLLRCGALQRPDALGFSEGFSYTWDDDAKQVLAVGLTTFSGRYSTDFGVLFADMAVPVSKLTHSTGTPSRSS